MGNTSKTYTGPNGGKQKLSAKARKAKKPPKFFLYFIFNVNHNNTLLNLKIINFVIYEII